MNKEHTCRSVGLAGLILLLVASTSSVQAEQTPQPRAKATVLPDAEWSKEWPEHSHDFTCQDGQGKVIIGRLHYGDEKESTKYRCALIFQFGQRPPPVNLQKFENYPASGNEVVCPANKVFTGRAHDGDENSFETLTCANILDEWDQPMGVIPDENWSQDLKENGHEFQCASHSVMIGKYHKGDENGTTRYLCGTLW